MRHLWYTAPAPDWFEALPLGNGRLGAKVFGRVERERIALNLDELWSGDGPSELGVTDGPATLAEIRRLLLVDGDRLAASWLARKLQGPLVESYQPLGDLEITDLVSEQPFTDYERRLDLTDGIVSVGYTRGGVRFERETYVSAPDQVLVWTVRADTPGAINTRLGLVSQHPARYERLDDSTVAMRGHAPAELTIEYRQSPDPIRYDEGRGIGFGVALRVYVDGGTVATGPDGITVRNANGLTAVLAGATTFKAWDTKPAADPAAAVAVAVATLDSTEGGLRERQVADHREMFGRVELSLVTPDEVLALPTDERIRRVAAGSNDPDLTALAFDFGRYLLMASSRPGTRAANLQGIWNEDRRPMWASDWTNNINTQMNYWAAEVVGLSDCAEPLFDNVVELARAGAATARDLYGAPGWVSHHNTDIWMTSWPVGAGGDDPVWSMSPSCGIWMSAHLMDHYRFTLDAEFLRNKAYPVLKGAAEFALSMLVEDSRGQVQIVPSTSPEHHFHVPTGEKASVDITTTYDIWLYRELFANLLEASALVDGDTELAKRAESAREALPVIPVGDDARIMEWSTDWPPSERHHRHHSHLYGLYPGTELEATSALADAARASIAVRAELGTPAGGWTHAWYVAFWARLGQGDDAGRVVREYLARLVSDNLLHRDGDIFQIDANFGITAGIAEMLLQSHAGVIRLLPALPSDWPDGAVCGLRARGGLTVDLEWHDGRLTGGQVTADHDGHYTLVHNDTRIELDLAAGQAKPLRPAYVEK
ncbi:glycoside hydrolase family 95 protein [Kribbella deserti]|uniref:Glycoside hydrolase N-terminal domain-containing protein n=1 Tax=Kribbella deserti TaxID=1926257 RepID=A0ABV6QDF5_9ACTN